MTSPITSKFFPAYAEIDSACCELYDQHVKYLGITHIVGVSRGGLVPAVVLSHLASVPLIPVSYSAKEGKGDGRNHTNVVPQFNRDDVILIVDDIADSGYTLKELVESIQPQVSQVYTTSLYYKITSVYQPDFWCWTIGEKELDQWVWFPWEVQKYERR